MIIELPDEFFDELVKRVADELANRSKPAVYTVQELADLAKCCDETVRRNVQAGVLTKIPGAGPIRIPGEVGREWLAGRGG